MKLLIYQVDAFAEETFSGNPAAVVPLDEWLDDETMQKIAAENNLSETAFFIWEGDGYAIRWFTPTTEVDLCGHATLASAHVLFEYLEPGSEKVRFGSKSGVLIVTKTEEGISLDFPAQPPETLKITKAHEEALGFKPLEFLANEDYIAVMENEASVREYEPDFRKLGVFDKRGIIVTAKGDHDDFVCRFFAPNYGIDEDPVTGSAFTQLIPYWSEKLGKKTMQASQLSKRGGKVSCQNNGERVGIGGKAVLYLRGEIIL